MSQTHFRPWLAISRWFKSLSERNWWSRRPMCPSSTASHLTWTAPLSTLSSNLHAGLTASRSVFAMCGVVRCGVSESIWSTRRLDHNTTNMRSEMHWTGHELCSGPTCKSENHAVDCPKRLNLMKWLLWGIVLSLSHHVKKVSGWSTGTPYSHRRNESSVQSESQSQRIAEWLHEAMKRDWLAKSGWELGRRRFLKILMGVVSMFYSAG